MRKLIDENKLKEWLDCNSESFGELCGEQLFTRTELERLCRKLIDELSEDREDNNKYITFVERVKPPKDRIIKEGKIPIKPNSLKEEEKEETYTCRCGLNQVIESFSKFGINSDDAWSNFNIISDEVKAEYLRHRVKWLEIDNAALCKELTEIKLKLKDLIK